MSKVIEEVEDECRRQIYIGYGPEHEDLHDDGSIAQAAACYATNGWGQQGLPEGITWPWDAASWKPKDRRRNLIRAAALLVAEIERLDRVHP